MCKFPLTDLQLNTLYRKSPKTSHQKRINFICMKSIKYRNYLFTLVQQHKSQEETVSDTEFSRNTYIYK